MELVAQSREVGIERFREALGELMGSPALLQ